MGNGKTNWTHIRITKEYLEKIQVLAVSHKRSATKELEVLIDEAEEKEGMV